MSLTLRQWVIRREHPVAAFAYRAAMRLRRTSLPVVPGLHRGLYELRRQCLAAAATAYRIVWSTPLFQSRLIAPAPGLFLYSGIPLIVGPVQIACGEDCRISGQTTITGRRAGGSHPVLTIGRNVDIGWQTTIAVGSRVIIGDNVRIAGRAFLAGYPGHPLDAADRALGHPDTEDQVGDIVLENDVWLATGVTVTAGVRIGHGTVVAAGSVVSRDLPPNVLAAGIPAKPIRSL